jgi:hypothetical protein
LFTCVYAPEINDINIKVSGVEKLISKLNPTKAAGPDNITPRVLKELAPFIDVCLFGESILKLVIKNVCLFYWF